MNPMKSSLRPRSFGHILEALFDRAWKPTAKLHLTTYYIVCERRGRFTGRYQHRSTSMDWTPGPHPRHRLNRKKETCYEYTD